jgi:hypothetical protein
LDVEKYLSGTKLLDKTNDAVNHILVELEKGLYVVVSSYAAKILACIARDSLTIADYIRSCVTAFNDARMMGIAYEVHIKNLLKSKVGGAFVVLDKNLKVHSWLVNSVTYYTSLSDLKTRKGRIESGDWFFPTSFVQGGFDLFQIVNASNGYKVRFVQVTIAETHSFKEDYFVDVLSYLRWIVLPDSRLIEVEIIGLVPEYRLTAFNYDPKIPTEHVYADEKIRQTVLHCTVPKDVQWLRNPIE